MELLEKIKQKKELNDLPDEFVKEVLDTQLKKLQISKESISELSKKEEKLIIKSVRSELRKYSGRFQASTKKRENLLNRSEILELLKTHSSTKERLDFYPELKKKIFSLKPQSILDLGCGLNPIALANSQITYNASDIKQHELSLIKKYFKKNKISGKVFVCDLRKLNSPLPKSDLCLIFKVLDILEKDNTKLAEKILTTVPCKKILASFSTTTLSGKPMNHPRRYWFENLIKKLNYKFISFKSKNEIFYLINKPNPKMPAPR